MDEETMLIGHSCGAGFLVRWLSEEKKRVGKVALIAPFLDPDGDEVESDFFHFDIDKEMIERTGGLVVFISTDDDKEIQDSVSMIKSQILSVHVIEFEDRGHFILDDMKTEEFPELEAFLVG